MNPVAKRTAAGLATGALVISLFLYCPLRAVMPLVVVLSALAQLEFYQLARKYEPVTALGLLAGTVWLVAVGLLGFGRNLPALACAGVSAAALFAAVAAVTVLFQSRRRSPMGAVASTLLGFFYVPFMMSFFLLWVQYPADGFWGGAGEGFHAREGLYSLMALIATAKFSDAGGFAFGMAFGRHRMCPSVSPKKSWEGLCGSMVFAAVTMCVFLALARTFGWSARVPLWGCLTYPIAAAAGVVLAWLATLGDLVESRFKREVDVKDSATFMPAGMGGFLDMFDSILFLPALLYPLVMLSATLLERAIP